MNEKDQRKLVERMNRVTKLAPGTTRCWKLQGIADIMRMEAEEAPNKDTADALERDALFLERLAYDLIQLREAVRGPSSQMEPYGSRHWQADEKEERP